MNIKKSVLVKKSILSDKAAQSEKLVQLEKVNIAYGKNEEVVLSNVDFCLCKGEIVGLCGDSGSGKSTLAYVLCGLKEISSGKINCPFDKTAMVLQNPETALNPMKSIGWTLAETRNQYLKSQKIRLPEKQELYRQLQQKLEEFGILKERLWDYPRKFSGGELQRISILRALLRESDILILDEATSMLDVLVQAKIMRFLLDIQKKYGLTYLVISHDIKLIKLICHRIYFVENGEIREGEVRKC